ncbi:hypothetical protein GIB67_025918, partial [Kingdonia uniflora]
MRVWNSKLGSIREREGRGSASCIRTKKEKVKKEKKLDEMYSNKKNSIRIKVVYLKKI